jgi:hypothetical protein
VPAVPIELSMSADAFTSCVLIGAALLAAWILVRFERVGPRSLTGAACGWAGAMLLIVGLPAFIEGVLASGLPGARVVVVFGLALPIFTYFFLTGGWFVRTLASLARGIR